MDDPRQCGRCGLAPSITAAAITATPRRLRVGEVGSRIQPPVRACPAVVGCEPTPSGGHTGTRPSTPPPAEQCSPRTWGRSAPSCGCVKALVVPYAPEPPPTVFGSGVGGGWEVLLALAYLLPFVFHNIHHVEQLSPNVPTTIQADSSATAAAAVAAAAAAANQQHPTHDNGTSCGAAALTSGHENERVAPLEARGGDNATHRMCSSRKAVCAHLSRGYWERAASVTALMICEPLSARPPLIVAAVMRCISSVPNSCPPQRPPHRCALPRACTHSGVGRPPFS